MAHPVRAAMVDELVASLDRRPVVAWATNSLPSKNTEDRWATGRAAWEARGADATHHLVIQDDALASPDIIAGLEAALEAQPAAAGTIVNPYLGTKRPIQTRYELMVKDAVSEGASWVVSRALSWGVGILCPVGAIDEMLAWCDTKRNLPYDTRIGRWWLHHHRTPCWHTWPSLLDHRQSPSIVGHSNEGRYAHRFLTSSALDVDWSGPVVVDPRVTAKGFKVPQLTAAK